MSATLPLFWDLSSVDKGKRIDASVELISTLEKLQASLEHRSAEWNEFLGEDDIEEEQYAQGASAARRMVHETRLDVLNAPDVAYSIRRLVRGLASPRESSRLGFAVALTELLSRVTTVSCAQILALLLEGSRATSNQTGQEERDLLFARLFGLTAIVHSGLFLRVRPLLPHSASAPSTLESCASVFAALRALACAKPWIAEAAYWAIGCAMDALAEANDDDLPWREEALRVLFDEEFGDSHSTDKGAEQGRSLWTPEKIALAMRAQRLWPEREHEWRGLWAPTIKHGNVLHPSNLVTLARILREGEIEDDESVAKIPSRAWRPQVHHVWDELLNELLSPEDSGRTPRGSFEDFFRIVVDESLFAESASNERKYWGFVIFQKALPRVKAVDLPMLFTKNFMRTWINHLSHLDRYLHSFARQIASPIISTVQRDPTLGLAFILQLTGVHGNQQFDKLTRTKTVESILTTMNVEGIKEYIARLMDYARGGHSYWQHDIQVIDARRSWVIEQFAALFRNCAIPKNDEWMHLILDWFVIHGIFIVKKKFRRGSPAAAYGVPLPPLSDNLRRECRECLLSCLADLTRLSAVTKSANQTQKMKGFASDGQLWISKVLQTIRQLEEDPKHVEPLIYFDQADREKLQDAFKMVICLRKVSGDKKEEAQGVELLLQSCILRFYVGDSNHRGDVASLESCIDSASRLFSLSQNNLDSNESFKDDELQVEPIDILADLIIGFLENGTAFTRAVGNQTFSLLSSAVKDSTIGLILTQLERRDPSELVADFDEIDEDDNQSFENNHDMGGGSNAESFLTGVKDDENSKSDEASNEELRKKTTGFTWANSTDAKGDMSGEESEAGPDDDQMLAMDDQLALIFKDRAREKKGKGKDGAQREATHFKNRILDLLNIFVRRQPRSPHILRLLVPLLVLTFSDEKQLSEKAAGLLKSRIGKLKEVPSAIDIVKTSDILNELHIRARKVHSRDALAAIGLCSLYVSRSLLSVGAEETVRLAYNVSLIDFTERKASDLDTQFFCDFIRRYPRAAWGMRAVLLDAPAKAVNTYRQGQAYVLLQMLLNHLPLLPDTELEEVGAFLRQLQCKLYSVISSACNTNATFSSNLKEVLKLALVGARTARRLAAGCKSFATIWEPTSWTELSNRLVAHDRFKASAMLVGICKQIIQSTQIYQVPSSIREAEHIDGQGLGVIGRSKRKADVCLDTGVSDKRRK
ncbi:DNA polymerase phi-domain-containing protein [Multifurca ochricompacta]|uniref:DNA polymerase phi-domain-containing protein n=1 Tax=Multifurca ochricompacta TaxID=376703 RepID=A0AAD4QG97_9AGAM|nr:DNA polymerase phi-domain-containing protein [Multifurca ochricompacta]